MSFWAQIKQFFGFTGVSVKLECPDSFSKRNAQVTGTLTITSKATQKVLSVEVELEEEWKTGRGDEQSTQTYTLGNIEFTEPFMMQANETKQVPFAFSFQMLKSSNDEMKEKGGVMGALGSVSAFMDGEKSKYTVKASVDVEGTPFDPGASKVVKLTD